MSLPSSRMSRVNMMAPPTFGYSNEQMGKSGYFVGRAITRVGIDKPGLIGDSCSRPNWDGKILMTIVFDVPS